MDNIACSILKANFLNLKETLNTLKDSMIRWIHYDVMDNHFVPNLSFGPWILENISNNFDFFLDVHLMVKIEGDIESYLCKYLIKNVKQISIHIESLNHQQILQTISLCNKNNILLSLAINPNTPINTLFPYINDLNNILIMSVEPGFGGQKFNKIVCEKIKKLCKMRKECNYKYKLQVDGGVNGENIANIFSLGVDWVVVGSWFTDNILQIKDKVKSIG
ncbi:ribulose-phosphate 3-epimerase [Spiroplasma endosymbiont of Aspidapion aeneum]|uniref:ribulose-phosphate 3-epimerase n=1 Tax=Spiroplasma endosymbiont of Aspidapion aeneum TaxID=3066276 RepID=UPI00313DB55B